MFCRGTEESGECHHGWRKYALLKDYTILILIKKW